MKPKKLSRFSLLLTLILAFMLALPQPVYAQDDGNGQIIFGGTYHLESGETLDGDLVIFGGQGTLDEGSIVDGEIFIAGGTLDISGTVNGDITATGGTVTLQETAVVNGDVNLIGAAFNQKDPESVRGRVRYNQSLDVNLFTLPFIPLEPLTPPDMPGIVPQIMHNAIEPIGNILWGLVRAFAVAALAALIVLLFPKPTERLAQSIFTQPLVSGGIGLLTVIVFPALLILLFITIILIPVGLIGVLALGAAALFGWVAVGYEIGKRFAVLLKQEWAPAVAAGIGTLILNIVSDILFQIPCIGWIPGFLVVIVGLGGIIISRFGTQFHITTNHLPIVTVPPSSNMPFPGNPMNQSGTSEPFQQNPPSNSQ